ncbi:MAG: D-Ala-D-Ala carboxypeptidase family metallohydrolase [Spirulinaceae cyanobacterium]
MTKLTSDQRNYYYLIEAERTGIYKAILAGLYEAHSDPILSDGETGLGMKPAQNIDQRQLDTLPEQIQYGANAIRALTDNLIAQDWQAGDLWDSEEGHYSKRFIEVVADGYIPKENEPLSARLTTCDAQKLWQAHLEDSQREYQLQNLPQNLAYLDRALLSLLDRIPNYYTGLAHQREALIEVIRMWRKLDSRQEVIASLIPSDRDASSLSDFELDIFLRQFLQRISSYYGGYPHQREALLRLTQLWRQQRSREEAIASLKEDTSPDPGLKIIDPALINFVERIPKYYEGKGVQRNAVTEGFRLWQKLDSRTTAVAALGIDPALLSSSSADKTQMMLFAAQLDRELLNFIRRLPKYYQEKEYQRESLIRMVQLWRGIRTRQQTIASLTEDLKRLEREQEATKPTIIIPRRPERWTTKNIQLAASIVPDGNFSWAEATKGGTRMPPNQSTVDGMVRIAKLAQKARERIGRPFIVTSWYRPPHINRAVGGVSNSRHIVGDAIDFVCEDLSGNQLYWLLDPWWTGGLGRYRQFSELCHIDGRYYRARWHY